MIGISFGVQCATETASHEAQHTATTDSLQAWADAHALEWALGEYAHAVAEQQRAEQQQQPAAERDDAGLLGQDRWYLADPADWRTLVEQYDWDVATAVRIVECESGGDEYAVSATNDWGLFQLHNMAITDPAENIAYAYGMYLDRHWQPWAASEQCWG